MAFSDLTLKVAAEEAVQALHTQMAPLSYFAKNYSELEDRKGATIAIPSFANLSAAAEFNVSTNNYGSGQNEVDGILLNLDKHFLKALAIDDRALLETDIQWIKDGSEAIAQELGRAANRYVFGLMNTTNVTLTANFDVGTKSQPTAHKLYEVAATNDLPIEDTVVVLDPENFADLLGITDFAMFGGREGVVFGNIPRLFSFAGVVMSQFIPEGFNGLLVPKKAVGMCSRYLAPLPGAYVDTWKATDQDSGLTTGWRVYQSLDTGKRNLCGELLFGAKLIMPGKIVGLKNT